MRMHAPWFLLVIIYAHTAMACGDSFICGLSVKKNEKSCNAKHLAFVREDFRRRLYETTGHRLCKGSLQIVPFYMSNLEPIAEERPRVNTPSSLKFIKSAYEKMLIETGGLSLSRQQEELSKFFINVVKPKKNDFFGLCVDPTGYGNICGEIGIKLHSNKSLIAMEEKIFATIEKTYNSPNDFTYAWGKYERLSEAQRKDYEGQLFWKGALKYGTLAQIEELVSLVSFSPDHSDAVYRCMMRYAIDEQISLIGILYKKYAGFAAHIDSKKNEQNSAAWLIYLRHCIYSSRPKALLESFKDKDGKVIDQLFMHTIVPFLSVKKECAQRAVAGSLEHWSNESCADDRATMHSRHEVAWTLANKNSAFKKIFDLEGACGASIIQWWANLQVVMAALIATKPVTTKNIQERTIMLKGAESTFARISSQAATALAPRDNDLRLVSHGNVLLSLLKEPYATDKMAYTWCEHALKSGINIAEDKYLSSISSLISSALFFKLVEPYSDKNPDLYYALGLLYENGHIKKLNEERAHIWFLSEKTKALEMYQKMVEKNGDGHACGRWIDLMRKAGKSIEDIECVLQKNLEQCSRKIFLGIQATRFLCDTVSGVDKNSINSRVFGCMDSIAKNIKFFESKITKTCPELVCLFALKTSYESLDYDIDRALGRDIDESQALRSVAMLCHATYEFAVHPNAPLSPVITNFFNDSVYKNLRNYAEKIVCKDPKDMTLEDLRAIATTAYHILRCKKETEADALLVKKIVEMASHKDMPVKWPPLMHVLAFKPSVNDISGQDTLFSHIKVALQEGIEGEELDHIARYEAEEALETLVSRGFLHAHMEFLMHNKTTVRSAIVKLAEKPIKPTPKKEIPACITRVNACGAYALLKDKLVNMKCTHCRTGMETVLGCWALGIARDGDRSDPLLKPFFDDMKLFKKTENADDVAKAKECPRKLIIKGEEKPKEPNEFMPEDHRHDTLFAQLCGRIFLDEDEAALCELAEERPTDPSVHALYVGKHALNYQKLGNKTLLISMFVSLEQARRFKLIFPESRYLEYITQSAKDILWKEAKEQHEQQSTSFDLIAQAVYLNKDKDVAEHKKLLEVGLNKHPFCSYLYVESLLQENGCKLIKDLPSDIRFAAYTALRYALMQGKESPDEAEQADPVTHEWANNMLKSGTNICDLGSALIVASTAPNVDFRSTYIGACPFKRTGNVLAFETPCDKYIAFAKEWVSLNAITNVANKNTHPIITRLAQEALFRLYFGKVYDLVNKGTSLDQKTVNFVHSILSYGVLHLKSDTSDLIVKKYLLSLTDQMIAKEPENAAFKKIKNEIEKL